MGCNASKTIRTVDLDDSIHVLLSRADRQRTTIQADLLDDSIHAMLKHDIRVAMKKGVSSPDFAYRPRAPHPLLRKKMALSFEDDDRSTEMGESVSSNLSWNISDIREVLRDY